MKRILFMLGLMACGTESQQSSESAFAAFLNMPKQSECNAQGKFYDNFNQPPDCSTLDVAPWPCSRQGLTERLQGVINSAEIFAVIDPQIAKGVDFHQCAESAGEIAIIFAGHAGTMASRWLYTFFVAGRFATGSEADRELYSSFTERPLFDRPFYIQDKLYSLSCNEHFMSFWVTPDNLTCTPISAKRGYGDVLTVTNRLGIPILTGAVDDPSGLIVAGSSKQYCYLYSGSVATKNGGTRNGSHIVFSPKPATSIKDLDTASVTGIAFVDETGCKAFIGE